MRCLYCGKELALLKRLTSGCEFCSDAHRQQYQNEYNQLALNRLLQAKPPAEVKPAAGTKAPETKTAAPVPAPAPVPAAVHAPVMVAATPAPVSTPVAMKVAEEVPEHPLPQAQSTIQEALPMETPIEEPAPADPAGFFLELPVPAMAAVMAMSSPDLGLEYTSAPAVPRRESETWGTELVAAGPVVIEPAISILDSGARATDRRVEMRDFVRGVPVVDVDLPAAQELGLPQAIVEPMQVPAIRYPPQEAVSLWQEPPREFAEYETELGELARAVFTTTGFEEGMNPASPQKAEERPMVAEPAVVAAPEPIPAPPVAPSAQNASLTASTSSVFRPLFSAPNQSAVPPAVEKKPDPVPEPHTKPMPVTLHGVAVGRGKPIQVYMAGVAASVDVQIPRSSALPLRPVMTLGPAPASEKD